MEREMLLSILATALFGVMVWLAAALTSRVRARSLESLSRASFDLLLPVLLGLMAVAFCVGWALREPDPTDEWATRPIFALAGLSLLAALRALWRAIGAWRVSPGDVPIATMGLWRPRVVVSPAFSEAASEDVLRAALAHEEAHRVARDPLRIGGAQLLTDLQWPIPGARRRFRAWLYALELRRDEEALARGAQAHALAEAILLAARLTTGARGIVAQARGDGAGLERRVRRLMERAHDGPIDSPLPHTLWRPLGALAVSLTASLSLGVVYGEAVLGWLLRVGP